MNDMNEWSDRYDLPMAAAYIRGMLGDAAGERRQLPLSDLTAEDCRALIALARERGSNCITSSGSIFCPGSRP